MSDGQTYGEVFHAEYAAAQRRFNRDIAEWGDLAPTEQASIHAGAIAVSEDVQRRGLAAPGTAADHDGSAPEPPKRYALVEQMGYRHDIAAVREVTFAGKQLIELTRLDDPAAVRLISPDSLYGITWLTEAEARSRSKSWTAAALPAVDDDEPDYDGRDDGMTAAERDEHDDLHGFALDAADEERELAREGENGQ